MIKTKGFTLAAGLAFGSLVAVGCGGGDDNGIGADANGNGDVDANGNGEADACEPGHGVRCDGVNLAEIEEGGEFRIETKEVGAYGRLALHSTEAFLFRDQAPEFREILGNRLNGGEPYEDGTVCWNKKELDTWNAITRAANQAIHESRTYLDAGAAVFMEAMPGGPRDGEHDDYELVKWNGPSGDPEAFDAVGRSQELDHPFIYRPAFTWMTTVVDGADPEGDPDEIYDPHYFTVVSANPEDPLMNEPNVIDGEPAFDVFDDTYRGDFKVPASAFYRPSVTGTAEVPEFRATNGWSVPDDRDLEEADFLLWHPTRFTMVTPSEEDYVRSGGAAPSTAFTAGEDFVFEIENHDDPSTVPENAPGTVNWIAINSNQGLGLDYYCLQSDKEAETITLPAEVIDDIDAAVVTITIGKVSHAMWAHDSRSLHAVGVTCKVGRGCVNADEDEDCVADYVPPEGDAHEMSPAAWNELSNTHSAAIREVFGR